MRLAAWPSMPPNDFMPQETIHSGSTNIDQCSTASGKVLLFAQSFDQIVQFALPYDHGE
jgi:hypothetical protein